MRLSTICESIIGDFEDAEMEVMILVLGLELLENINENKTFRNIGIIENIWNMAKMLTLLKILNKTPWCNTSISSHRCTTGGRASNPCKSFFAKTRTGSKMRKNEKSEN